MSFEVRTVNLHMGPYDGAQSMASHITAVYNGEVYVWDGSDDMTSFVHAVTALKQLPETQWRAERDYMKAWTENPTTPIKDEIPAWRVNAWVQLLRVDKV